MPEPRIYQPLFTVGFDKDGHLAVDTPDHPAETAYANGPTAFFSTLEPEALHELLKVLPERVREVTDGIIAKRLTDQEAWLEKRQDEVDDAADRRNRSRRLAAIARGEHL